MIAVPVSVYSLGCDRLNVTLLSETSPALSGVVLCPGVAKSRVPTDPAHPGTVMDSWTDIVLGDSLNLNGSVDTTDCYCGAGEHSSAAIRVGAHASVVRVSLSASGRVIPIVRAHCMYV